MAPVTLATKHRSLRPLGILVPMAAVGAAAFFRDPERTPERGAVLAPADGVISAIDHSSGAATRISTYMRLHDVHVNRAPTDAVVCAMAHQPGGNRPAFRKDSDLNERLHWTLDTQFGTIQLVQIAGAFARRIVPYRGVGEALGQGDRIGLIRFGSRVDLYLPPGLQIMVHAGRRVRAGVDVVARS